MLIVKHPGPRDLRRVLWIPVQHRAISQFRIEEGRDLLGAIRHYVGESRGTGAWFRLVGGEIALLEIMTGKPDDAPLVATFCGPHVMNCPASVVAGSGNLGLNNRGSIVSHCHVAFRDRDGRLVGGHLIEGNCIAGPGGLVAEIGILSGGQFSQRNDAETGFTLFYPEGKGAATAPSILLKLQPNQDLTLALESACVEAGITRAVIRSAVGSLNEAVLEDDTGGAVRIDGPGLEVAGLSGEVMVADGSAHPPPLRAFVCQADGNAVEGAIVRGQNPICVTFEILLDRKA